MSDLRPHQLRAVYQVETAWREGVRRVLCVMPTGAGKTRTAAHIMRRHVDDGGRVLFVVHRQELVTQTRDALVTTGVDESKIRIIAAGSDDGDQDAPVCIASIQTLLLRGSITWPVVSLLVLDEAHHYASPEWCRLPKNHDGRMLGLTATPERGDGRPMGDLFDKIVAPTSVQELTEQGVLVPCTVIAPVKRLRGKTLAGHPHDALIDHRAEWSRAVVFAASIDHASEISDRCNSVGLRAATVHGQMPSDDRTSVLAKFRAGDLDVAVNVFVLTEGFDDPAIDACVLARGCSHAGTYLQMVGRVIRASENKVGAIVLDLTGVVHEHGLPSDDREYSLEGTAIRASESVAIRQCRVCGMVARYRPTSPSCEQCGEPWPSQPLPKISKQEMQAIMDSHSVQRRVQAWNKLKSIVTMRGYKMGWAIHRYKAMYGTFPPSSWLSASQKTMGFK